MIFIQRNFFLIFKGWWKFFVLNLYIKKTEIISQESKDKNFKTNEMVYDSYLSMKKYEALSENQTH